MHNRPHKGQPWILRCRGHIIGGNMEKSLRYLLHDEETKLWWAKKLKIEDRIGEVSWSTYESIRVHTPRRRQLWTMKFGADLLPTRQNLVKRNHSSIKNCPWCNNECETTDHIFQCTSEEMNKCFNDELDKLQDFLAETTSTEIKNNLLDLIRCIRSNQVPNETVSSEVEETKKK